MTPTFTILGTGALGGFYGSRLLHSGATVQFIAHSDVEFIREHGLRVDSPLGNLHHQPVAVYAASDAIPPSDVVCIAEQLMVEVVAGAAVCGVQFADDFPAQLLETTAQMKPYAPSMRLDYLAKRELEIEYLYRRPLREVAQHGMRLPAVEAITRLLTVADHHNRSV